MNPFPFRLLVWVLLISGTACSSTYTLSVKEVNPLTSNLREVSGLTLDAEKQLWGLNDSGNPATLYQIDQKGNLLDSVSIEGSTNKDWEALTIDPEGTFYIIDGGNNGHNRKDLKVYSWDMDSKEVKTIPFSYENQTEFPPAEEKKFFDLEAAFWDQGNIYLIGKNRFGAAEAGANVYKLSLKNGSSTVSPFTRLDLGKFVATDAALSPSGTLAVLAYRLAPLPNVPGLQSRLFLIDNWKGEGSYTITAYKKVPSKGLLRQYEAIEWINDEEVIIGSEEIRGRGPVLIKVRLKKRK